MLNCVPGTVAIFIALSGTALAMPAADDKVNPLRGAKAAKKKAKAGPRGPAGPQGPQGPAGPSTGPASGALAGVFPGPSLNVSGGPCPNGQELVNVSALAALTCSAGVYSDANDNVAAGPTAFPALLGSATYNTAVGRGALDATTSGGENTAVGQNALGASTTGNFNSAFGQAALLNSVSGSRNTALGHSALAVSTASDNTAVGTGTLDSDTTGADNTAVGEGALGANTTGGSNTAFGEDAMGLNTTTSNNSAFGRGALDANTGGTTNTAIGQNALGINTTGSGNAALGFGAGGALTTGGNNIDIANNGVVAEANTTRIGTSQTRAFIAGVSGVTTGAAAVPALVDSNGQLGTASSSRRVKRDIAPLGGLRPLMKLRPVSFRYRSGAPERHFGLIAEQVARVLPELAVRGADGRPESVQYQELPAMLLAKVQDQQRQIARQRLRAARQQAQIDWLMRRVGGR